VLGQNPSLSRRRYKRIADGVGIAGISYVYSVSHWAFTATVDNFSVIHASDIVDALFRFTISIFLVVSIA
jgi:hypothetical protein